MYSESENTMLSFVIEIFCAKRTCIRLPNLMEYILNTTAKLLQVEDFQSGGFDLEL